MAFDKDTDFLGLFRLIAGVYSPARMPPIDFMAHMLWKLGIIDLVEGDTEPATDQPKTAWLDTAAPSYGANGELKLWDAGLVTPAYVTATPWLFGALLAASSNLSDVTLHSGTGVPDNALGDNGDYYRQTDETGGLYGPKADGSWPTTPMVGTYDDMHTGTGVPPVALGRDGDIYTREDAPGGLYAKKSGAWTLIPGTLGVTRSGTGVPASGLGGDGDIYGRLDAPGGIYIKIAGTWTLIPGTSIVAASTTVAGVVERATNAEATARSDTVRFVTPAQLPPNASTAAKGIEERATDAEALTGTDNTRFITPKHLKTGLDSVGLIIPIASTTEQGISERATDAEAVTGTDTERHITPKHLKTGLDSVGGGSLYQGGSQGFAAGSPSIDISTYANPDAALVTVSFTSGAVPVVNGVIIPGASATDFDFVIRILGGKVYANLGPANILIDCGAYGGTTVALTSNPVTGSSWSFWDALAA